ncbi:hypothetical protein GF319_15450, partial [Candidatus Bathyarchaeota archaeon]|nr:hypothetical protein [Candidatus Bathyarchaeota archaeon]
MKMEKHKKNLYFLATGIVISIIIGISCYGLLALLKNTPDLGAPTKVRIGQQSLWTSTLSPNTDNEVDLGSTSKRVRTIYGHNASLSESLWVDGTASISGTSYFYDSIDMGATNIEDVANIVYQTGAVGGTIRTGTSNADKFILQAYDVDDGVYRNILELDAGNDITASATFTNLTVPIDITGTEEGNVRYNSSDIALQYFDGSSWHDAGSSKYIYMAEVASAGNVNLLDATNWNTSK